MRATPALCCVALLLAGGCGGSGGGLPGGQDQVAVTVKVTHLTWPRGNKPARQVTTFSLTCNPTGGTLPLAARVCRAIRLHPRAMLDPPPPRSGCSVPVAGPALEVTATFNGKTTHLGGPFCAWPGGASAGVFFAATLREGESLAGFERQLRCDEDPALLAEPTPWTRVQLCQRGSDPARRAEVFVGRARKAIDLPLPHPILLKPGSARCTMHAGDASRSRIAGRCSVSVTGISSTPTVTFVQTWPQDGKTVRHTWRVVVDDFGGKLVAESGPPPPQLWR